MGDLWIFYLKTKGPCELQPLYILSLWDNWDQSFQDMPFRVVLFPNKEIAKVSNWSFSKKYLQGCLFYSIFFILCQKKYDYLKWINFRVDLISRVANFFHFAWINFRDKTNLNSFRVDLISRTEKDIVFQGSKKWKKTRILIVAK